MAKKIYIRKWKAQIKYEDIPRLYVYKEINPEFLAAKHISLPFLLRKMISKIRCSDHPLRIEKGRHLKIPREARLCEICQDESIENELHFLINCETYEPLKTLFELDFDNLNDLLRTEDQSQLGKYLLKAFEVRTNYLNGKRRE